MPRSDIELAHLREAERHVSEAERRIIAMKELLAVETRKGRDTGRLRGLIDSMELTLDTMNVHLRLMRRFLGDDT